MIPKGAAHKYTAEVMIDFCYDPTIAAQIEAYVNYICPVKGAAGGPQGERPRRRQQPADLPAGRHPGQAAHLQVGLSEDDEKYFNDQFATVGGLRLSRAPVA